MKVRITSRVFGFVSGSHTYQLPDNLDEHGYGEAGRSWARKMAEGVGRERKDESFIVDLTDDELEVLDAHVEVMAIGAADNAGWDRDALAELNAARGLLRQIAKARGR